MMVTIGDGVANLGLRTERQRHKLWNMLLVPDVLDEALHQLRIFALHAAHNVHPNKWHRCVAELARFSVC